MRYQMQERKKQNSNWIKTNVLANSKDEINKIINDLSLNGKLDFRCGSFFKNKDSDSCFRFVFCNGKNQGKEVKF